MKIEQTYKVKWGEITQGFLVGGKLITLTPRDDRDFDPEADVVIMIKDTVDDNVLILN